MRFVLTLLFVAVANAAQLLRVSEPIPGRYIVKIKSGTKVHSVLPTVRLAGGRVRSIYDNVLNGFAAELSDKVLDIVLNLPAVEYVEEDGVARAMGSQTITDDGLWGLDRIDQRTNNRDGSYNYPGTGSGITVYVFDTGIRSTHNDFGNRVTGHVDCTSGTCMMGGNDGNGHGTHCAGTVGGSTYGVAKDVDLVGVKVLSDSGGGSWSGIIAGINWVKVDAADIKAIASMSLGGGGSQSTDNAVADLITSGVPTVVAAGNSNANACNVSPARVPTAVTVGATNIYDTRWVASNWGSCLDIFAPGEGIKSAWYNTDSATLTDSGTSMACPHVAGALAIALEDRSGDAMPTPSQLTEELLNDATSGVVANPGLGSPNLLLYVNP